MDRTTLHDVRNALAVAIGTLYAMIDGKLPSSEANLQEVLSSAESVDALLMSHSATSDGEGREALLQAIVEGSPYAKILVSETGLIVLVNRQTEELFGYTREQLIGQPIEMLVPRRFRSGHPELRDSFHHSPTARPMGAGRDLYGLRSDESEFPVEIGLNPVRIDGNRFTLAAISDITERKRAEDLRIRHAGMQQHAADIERLNRQLEEASTFKSQFVATMSHELRTPLTAIVGAAELLRRTDVAEPARSHVEMINEAAEALLALIRSVLDFSKIEAGMLELQIRPLRVDAVVGGAAEVVAQLARPKGLSVQCYVDPVIPPVFGDADCLRQVLLNLLGNAVKFTQQGEVLARAFPLEVTDREVRVRFEVQDTGPGVPSALIPRLFQPFVQANAAEGRNSAGTGLGLSISRRMVELMGGAIGAESTVGQGSLFWFEVPFQASGQAMPETLPQFAGSGALIAVRNETLATILDRYLSAWGMRHHRVADVAELRAALGDREYSEWIAIVDRDDTSWAELGQLDDALRERLNGRLIELGSGSLRKPLRQSNLFDAIARTAGLERPAVAREAECGGAADPLPVLDLPILVAEDNVQLRRLLKLQLDELHLPIFFVENGAQAVAAVRDRDYAMVFMDCQMPSMDGFEATREIRKAEQSSGKHVSIVAMTANAFAEDREACLAAGMDDYLAKPVRLARLRGAVQRWAETSAQPR